MMQPLELPSVMTHITAILTYSTVNSAFYIILSVNRDYFLKQR
jgi:hypothetical protein